MFACPRLALLLLVTLKLEGVCTRPRSDISQLCGVAVVVLIIAALSTPEIPVPVGKCPLSLLQIFRRHSIRPLGIQRPTAVPHRTTNTVDRRQTFLSRLGLGWIDVPGSASPEIPDYHGVA